MVYNFKLHQELQKIIVNVLPAQDLMSLLEPEHDPPFFSTMPLDLDRDCFPVLALQDP